MLVSGTRYETVFGEIVAIVKGSCGDMFLLVNCVHATFASAFSFYVLESGISGTILLRPCQLLDRTPYRPYTVFSASVICLNSSFPEEL